MKAFTAAVLLLAVALALCAHSSGAAPVPAGAAKPDAVSVTAQFDNRAYRLTGGKKPQIIAAMAKVFGVPPTQVQMLNAIDQSGIRAQSVATFKVTGPSSQRKPVLQICKDVTSAGVGGIIGIDPPIRREIKKATESWLPADKIELQKATCAQA